MYNQYISFSAKINNKWQRIDIQGKQLFITSFFTDHIIIDLEHNVGGIAMGKEKLFIESVDIRTDGSTFYDNQLNNIVAYDYKGKYLYRIGDIIPEDKTNGYAHIYKNGYIFEKRDNDGFYPDKAIKGHEYLRCTSVLRSKNYIIDITDDKFFIAEDTR